MNQYSQSIPTLLNSEWWWLYASNVDFRAYWGHVIKQVIAAASKEDKDRASPVLPITQQLGFALGR